MLVRWTSNYTCPHEASAAQVARVLLEHEWKNVRPLNGGFEAWEKAGGEVIPKYVQMDGTKRGHHLSTYRWRIWPTY